MIGETISHYSIVEQLGAGGMGVVYRARDERLERDVALKVLAPSLVHDKTFLERFRREARLLSKLNHPNIATVHDFDTVDGTSFLVMELIAGETLDRLVKIRPLPEAEIIRLGTQLLTGLAAAHDGGIVHRDLKPSNLRETPDGRLKILDFGLARIVQSDPDSTQSTTVTAGVVGTLPYMSPEQLRGETVDARTDLYSAGVVLYELATGRRPFTETLGPSLIDCILHRAASPVRELNPRISPELEAIILKALEKEPERRYRSAREMCAALQRLGTGNATGTTVVPEPPSIEHSQAPPMEIAHVLFTDIVGYSKLPMDEQQRQLRRLQNLVRETAEFERARSQQQLISLPTGDGMALVFFGEPESAARCALELDRKLRQQPEIKLRMGINSGPVYRVADINANRNVAGGGINIAHHVMDCGDAGHILVSKAVVDVLGQLGTWQRRLHDLGDAEVKHGVRVHLYNLYDEQTGNAKLPEKLRKSQTAEGLGPRKQWKTYAAVLAGILALGVAAGFLIDHYRKNENSRSASTNEGANRSVAQPLRPRLAVMGFKNLGNASDESWIASSMTEMVGNELEYSNRLVTTPGERVNRAKKDLDLGEDTNYTEEKTRRLQAILHCDYLVYGSFFASGKAGGGKVRVSLRLQDANSGETLASFTEEGTEPALNEVAARLGVSLREKLHVPSASPEDSDAIQAAIPSTTGARKSFYEGLERLRNFDFLGARDLLQKSLQEDANFAPAHASLAEAWFGLGYDERAKQEARKAFELSRHLPREDQRLVEAQYREMSSEWDQAVDIYKSLWTIYPETPEYALSAADVQIRAGKGTEALKTIQQLRAQGGAIARDPRLDLREAEAAASLGNWATGRDAAGRAANVAGERGSRLLQAEALWRNCEAVLNLGDAGGAQPICSRALGIAEPLGDFKLMARASTILGRVAEAQGNLNEALAAHRKALEYVTKIGSRRDMAGAYTNIGNILAAKGESAAAEKSDREGLAQAREVNDQGQIELLLNNLADENNTNGNFSEALHLYQQSLETARAIQDKPGIARGLGNMGAVFSLQGNFSRAAENIQEAIRIAQEGGLKSDLTQYLLFLGETKRSQGNLADAESNYMAAKSLATEMNEKASIAQAQYYLGLVRLFQGNAQEASMLGQQAAAEFKAEGMKDQESQARNLIASCLLELNRPGDAASELEGIESLKIVDPTIRLPLATTAGRIATRIGKTAQARKSLEDVVLEAKRLGIPGIQFEAKLAQAEIGLFGGDKNAALSTLAGVRQEAGRRGYKLFEAKAKEMAAKISGAGAA